MAVAVQTVMNWQRILQAQGIYKGPIDGNADSAAFIDALSYWQNINSLTSSGRIDEASTGRLSAFFQGVGGGSGISDADRNEVIKRFGVAMVPYLNNPELGPLLVDAQKRGLGEPEMRALIQNSNYWKWTNETQRNWEALKVTDPAAANRALDQQIATVRDKAASLGINWLQEADLRRLANDTIANGWDQNDGQMLTDVLVNVIQSQRPNQELIGSAGALMGELKRRAAGQLLSIDDTTAFSYAMRITKGEASLDGYDVLFRQQAKAKAPYAAQLIDDGVLLSDVFDQQRQRIAQQLEVDPEYVDFVNDPRWRDVTSYLDPKTGQTRGMTETEAEILARKQPEWADTAGANDQAAQVTDFLSTAWGVRGRG